MTLFFSSATEIPVRRAEQNKKNQMIRSTTKIKKKKASSISSDAQKINEMKKRNEKEKEKTDLRHARRTHGSSVGGGYGDNADSAFHLSLSLSISPSISLSLALSLPRSLHPISSRQSHRHSRPIDFRGCRRRVARSELSLSRTHLSLDAPVDRMSVLHDRRVPDRHRRNSLLSHLKPFRPKHPDLQS